jgi:uncharacterized protein YndB with AHSA1/START domain
MSATTRSVTHADFTVERTYPATPSRVFAAWSDPEQKAKWFGSPGGGEERSFDFRVGGTESMRGTIPNGTEFTFEATYRDIVEGERIVYSYDMTMDGARISVSLAVVEIVPDGDGTRMTVTEHGAYLDGLDTMEQRRQGTEDLMDALGVSLA